MHADSPARRSKSATRATSSPGSASSRPRRVTPSARPTRRSRSSRSCLPGAGDRRRDRAEDEGRPGEAGDRAPAPLPRRTRPSASRATRRPGQTVIRGMGELHLEVLVDRMMREFGVECERRQAAGRLPRDDPPGGQQGHRASSSARPAAAASTATSSSTSPEPRQGLGVREQDQGRRDPDRVHLLGREGHGRGARLGHQGRLPDGRRQGRADRRLLPRRRLLRDGVQDRRLDGDSGGCQARQAGAARAR